MCSQLKVGADENCGTLILVLSHVKSCCDHIRTSHSEHMVNGRVLTCIISHWTWMQLFSNNSFKVLFIYVYIPYTGNMSITYYSSTTTAMPFVFIWCYDWCSFFKLSHGYPGERCHVGKRRNCPVVSAQILANMHVGDPHQPASNKEHGS